MIDGWIEGRKEGWMDGRMDGWIDRQRLQLPDIDDSQIASER